SLIKCGAFDTMHTQRAQLFEALEGALARSGEIQKDRESGQSSLFEAFDANASSQSLPNVPEWPENVKLAYEKELLGFYVTGHPLERYRKELKSYSTIHTNTAIKKREGEEVVIGGLVNKLKYTQTKKNNEKMAIITIEDLEGSIEALVFPRSFKECGHH